MHPRHGIALVLAAAVLWGSTGTAQELGAPDASTLGVGAVRLVLGAAALMVIAAAGGGFRPTARIPPVPVVAMALGIALYQVTFFAAVRRYGVALGTLDVAALPAGDSAFGCRQMVGNAWEWTDTVFGPYPGFVPDMYRDYSQPLFGTTRVLRGGCWATRGRLIRNTWRNYYGPDRNDVFAGFRTCAL